MSAQSEASPRSRRRGRIAATLAAPALILLSPVVALLRQYEYGAWLPESLILMAGAAMTGVAVGALSLLRPRTLEPALITMLIVLVLMTRTDLLEPLLRSWPLNLLLEGVGAATAVLVVYGALLLPIAILCRLLRQHLSTIVIAAFGTFVVSTALLPMKTHGDAFRTGELPDRLNDLPPVIHIILDEHIGLAGLPPEIPESAAAEQSMRRVYRDFGLYSRAYSRFSQTEYALASIMNGAQELEIANLIEEDQDGFDRRLIHNDWFRILKERGYAISVYQNSWLDLCSGAPVDVCDTHPHSSLNPMQRSSLPVSERMRVLGLTLLHRRALPPPSPLAGMEAMERFETDLAQAPRGVAYILHLLLPHHAYMYRADCSLADSATWETLGDFVADVFNEPAQRRVSYIAYLNQVTCTALRIESLFVRLKRLGIYEEATIIVHSDHGSRIATHGISDVPVETLTDRDAVDLYSTLLAIKTPATVPRVVRESIAVQDVFAQTFLDDSVDRRRSPPDTVLMHKPDGSFAARSIVWPDERAIGHRPDTFGGTERGGGP